MPAKSKLGNGQLPLFVPQSGWRPPDLATLPSWQGAKRIGFDVETWDPHLKELGPGVRRGAKVVGYSFAIEDGPKHYIPFAHGRYGGYGDSYDNLPEANALAYLHDQFKAYRGDIVGANLSYELDYLLEMGVDVSGVGLWRDVQIAEPLIDELQQNYKLDTISKKYGMGGKNEDALKEAASTYNVDPKSGLHLLPARHVGAYAEDDAAQPLKIMRKQEKIIDDDELWDVFKMESRLMPLLVRMRRRGVAVDQKRLHQIEEWSIKEEREAWEVVRRETKVAVPMGGGMQVKVIADAMRAAGLPVGTTDAGNDSVKSPDLEKMQHPVAQAIVRARRFNKLRSTFAASIRTHMVNGRIHCEFNQLRKTDEDGDDDEKGVKFGRLSSGKPNMQQQPGRDEETGPVWRSIYVPDFGHWGSLDFSQQEPKWSFHLAAKKGLPGAAELCKIFTDDPTADCYDPLAEAAGINRKLAKIIWLGRSYGMGGGKMCKVHLNLPTQWVTWDRANNCRVPIHTERGRELLAKNSDAFQWEDAGPEGQAIIDKFDNSLPFLKKLAKLASKSADQFGFIRTYLGRRCHFPVVNGKPSFTHKALNRAIQGSAADQTKMAMLALEDAGYPLQLQVHDEVNASVESRDQANAMAKIMCDVIPMSVPMRVDVELGTSWGESMKVGKPERPYVWNL